MADMAFSAAYHEAGHAVVARLFGGELVEIWIDPEEAKGETIIRWPSGEPSTDERIMVNMASDACLTAFALDPPHEKHFWGDAAQVIGLIDDLFPDDEVAQTAHRHQLDRATARLFESPEVKAAAEAIAQILVKRLRLHGDEANRVIDSRLGRL